MTDMRADDQLDDGDRLPWLEAVEDDENDGPPAGKLIALVIIGLVAIGLIVGGVFWLKNRPRVGGNPSAPEVIAAPQGDYKVKPAQPGGMKVEGEGQTVFATGAGADLKGKIDVSAVPETPVAKPTPAAKAPPPAAKAAPVQVAKTTPAPAPQETAPAAEPSPAPATGGGRTIQLGAFSSEAAANGAWKALSGRFGYLAPLSHSVTTVTSGGRTLYRLRASGPGASDVCGRLRVAGEQCVAM